MDDNYRFPTTRCGLTRKFKCGIDVYLTVNAKRGVSWDELRQRVLGGSP